MTHVVTTTHLCVVRIACLTHIMTQICAFQAKKVLEWREREHEDMDRAALRDPLTLNSLQRCGLLKLFCMTNMHAQVRLLESLFQLWDPKQDMFDIKGKHLK